MSAISTQQQVAFTFDQSSSSHAQAFGDSATVETRTGGLAWGTWAKTLTFTSIKEEGQDAQGLILDGSDVTMNIKGQEPIKFAGTDLLAKIQGLTIGDGETPVIQFSLKAETRSGGEGPSGVTFTANAEVMSSSTHEIRQRGCCARTSHAVKSFGKTVFWDYSIGPVTNGVSSSASWAYSKMPTLRKEAEKKDV